MSEKSKLATEVGLVWEVMTCLGLRSTYDRPDSPCQWFHNHYGPYSAFSSCEGPLGEIRTDKESSFPAQSRGKRYNIPEIMGGCRKAPIMSIGINPNLTAYQYGINGTTWCYPYFDDIEKYAEHFRYRTVNQERFHLAFIKQHLEPGTETIAAADGKITGFSVKNDVLALTLSYDDGDSEVVRLPVDHVLMFDTHGYGDQPKNAFSKGDVLAAKVNLPENVLTEVVRESVGYYKRFQEMVDRFRSGGDEALQNSEIRLGEDASMGDMVSCASPGWNAYFPDAVREGIVNECVMKRQYFRRQVIQSRPAVIIFSGKAALQMFLGAFPVEVTPKIDQEQTTYERLKGCSETPYWLNFSSDEVSFRSRMVFSPHFSYSDSFDAGCRVRPSDWDEFKTNYPDDASVVADEVNETYSGILVSCNPDDEPYSNELSADGKAFLVDRYIDPIETIAGVMLQEYDEERLQLDDNKEHLLRTDGPCRFCSNELFQLERGCLYGKDTE